MRAHERGTPIISHRATHCRASRGHRVAIGGYQVKVVAFPGPLDPGLYASPEQHAQVRRLTAATRVEGRPVKHDAVLAGMQHDRVPLAQRLIGELEAVRTPVRFSHVDGSARSPRTVRTLARSRLKR